MPRENCEKWKSGQLISLTRFEFGTTRITYLAHEFIVTYFYLNKYLLLCENLDGVCNLFPKAVARFYRSNCWIGSLKEFPQPCRKFAFCYRT